MIGDRTAYRVEFIDFFEYFDKSRKNFGKNNLYKKIQKNFRKNPLQNELIVVY